MQYDIVLVLAAMRKIESTLTFSLFINSTEGKAVLKTFSPACWVLNNSTASLRQKQKIIGISIKIESTPCSNFYVFCQRYLYHHRRIKVKKTQSPTQYIEGKAVK